MRERGQQGAYQDRGCTKACFPQSRPVTREKAVPLASTRKVGKNTHERHRTFPWAVCKSKEIQPGNDQAGVVCYECNGAEELEQGEEGECNE